MSNLGCEKYYFKAKHQVWVEICLNVLEYLHLVFVVILQVYCVMALVSTIFSMEHFTT
jgi:hypothetical protein